METLCLRQRISGSVEAPFIVACRNTESRCRKGERLGVSAYRRIGASAWPRGWLGRIRSCGRVISKGKLPDVQRRLRGSADPTPPRTPTRPHADTLPRSGPKALVGRGLLCFGDWLLAFNRWLLRRSV